MGVQSKRPQTKPSPGVWPKRPQVCRSKRPKQNVPDADQGFFSITGCGDKMLIDVFIQYKSLTFMLTIAYAWVADWRSI